MEPIPEYSWCHPCICRVIVTQWISKPAEASRLRYLSNHHRFDFVRAIILVGIELFSIDCWEYLNIITLSVVFDPTRGVINMWLKEGGSAQIKYAFRRILACWLRISPSLHGRPIPLGRETPTSHKRGSHLKGGYPQFFFWICTTPPYIIFRSDHIQQWF